MPRIKIPTKSISASFLWQTLSILFLLFSPSLLRKVPNAQTAKGSATLIDAVANNDIKILPQLVAAGADIEASNSQSWTALAIALFYTKIPIARELIRLGANVDVTVPYQQSDSRKLPIIYVMLTKNLYESAELLIKSKANLSVIDEATSVSPLTLAGRRGNLTLINMMLDAGADINFGRPLDDAADKKQWDVIRLLVKRGANLELPTSHLQLTPLIFAASNNLLDAVKLFIELGANIEATDPQGFTALTTVVNHGYFPIAEHLLQLGAQVSWDTLDMSMYNRKGINAPYLELFERLMDLALNQNPEFPIRALFEKVLVRDNERLLVACTQYYIKHTLLEPAELFSLIIPSPYEKWISTIAKLGLDVNSKTVDGDTLLHTAISIDNLAAIKLLIRAGFDVNLRNAAGETGLDFAKRMKKSGAIKYLSNFYMSDLVYAFGYIALLLVGVVATFKGYNFLKKPAKQKIKIPVVQPVQPVIEYQPPTLEQLATRISFGTLTHMELLDNKRWVLQISLPDVLARNLYEPIQIAGFIARDEPLNHSHVSSVLTNFMNQRSHWRGTLINQEKMTLTLSLSLPKQELTIIKLSEWIQLLKNHLIESTETVIEAKFKNSLLNEITQSAKKVNSTIDKIKAQKKDLEKYTDKVNIAKQYTDKIPMELVAKFNYFKKMEMSFLDKVYHSVETYHSPLKHLEDERLSLEQVLQTVHACSNELAGIQQTLDEIYVRYSNYRAALDKKSKTVSINLPVPIKPVISIIEEKKISPPLSPSSRSTSLSTSDNSRASTSTSSSSSSTSSKAVTTKIYDDATVPMRVIFASKSSLMFERPIEETLNMKKKAIYSHAKKIIANMVKSKNTLLVDELDNITRRQTIYRLIDQLACLHLALQEMQNQNMFGHGTILTVVRKCRDLLRHQAEKLLHADLDHGLNKQLQNFIINLPANIDREIRKSAIDVHKAELQEFEKSLIIEKLADDSREVSFIADLEFIKHRSQKFQNMPRHERFEAENLDYYVGLISQIGNHIHAYLHHSSDLFKSLLGSSKLIKIEDFAKMSRIELINTLTAMHPGNLLYLCLQIRNMRGHEIETEMILPVYQIAPNVYFDPLDNELKESLFMTLNSEINRILEHVKQTLAQKSASTTERLHALPITAVNAIEYKPMGLFL